MMDKEDLSRLFAEIDNQDMSDAFAEVWEILKELDAGQKDEALADSIEKCKEIIWQFVGDPDLASD